MRFIGKKMEAYECFANYKSGNNAKECQQLIDIFLPMMFQENKNKLEISIGRRISEKKFVSLLCCVSKNFVVIPTMYNNEPQMIIRDSENKNTIALINLALIKNIHIVTNETENWCLHDICFNYNNEVDYMMHIVVDR